MSESFSLLVLGAAATEGIKFLYGQAAEVLGEWRKRPKRGLSEESDLDVPVLPQDVLDAKPSGSTASAAAIARDYRDLVRLAGVLSPYALGQADVDADDMELAGAAGQLRDLLESIYGQRFTFRGERRGPTGSLVSVRQRMAEVVGEVLGADADVSDGTLAVDQEVTAVREGGSITGFSGRIGSPEQ
jgi:hypothetical protein